MSKISHDYSTYFPNKEIRDVVFDGNEHVDSELLMVQLIWEKTRYHNYARVGTYHIQTPE